MSSAELMAASPDQTAQQTAPTGGANSASTTANGQGTADDGINFDSPECFIPVTRYALMDRLTHSHAWPGSQANEARRFFRYLDFWRQQSYAARMLEIEQNYEPFSPDSDLLITRKFSDDDLLSMRKALIGQVEKLLMQANYVRIDPKQVDIILTQESAYGLELTVDLDAFEEILMYYRGASNETRERRSKKKFYLKMEEYDVPIFQRLFVLFKLKPEGQRVREVMAKERLSEKAAKRFIKKMSGVIPDNVKRDFVYMKMFKNIPRSDMEMCFPNTKVKFRMHDKLKLGVTAGGGTAMGVASTVGKLAAATTPVGMAAATLGLGGVAVRQASSFMSTRQRYMVTMAQNLYFHSMADNRGVITLMADRAVEEDIKEEMLLYSVLAKDSVYRHELPDVKVAIEQHLYNAFEIDVHFDLHDALERLMEDGIVTENAQGLLETLPPNAAALHIDHMWDNYLDELPDPARGKGSEVDSAESL